jgi:signal transduction histidine kinase
MKSEEVLQFNIGSRLTLTFAVLIALILGGNGLIFWQFHIARLQTDRLTGISQQAVEVLRLRESLLSFHQRLDEIALNRDAGLLVDQTKTLRRGLLDQVAGTRDALAHLPPETHLDPGFLPTLDAIEIALPSQIEAIKALATSGDWDALGLRIANELKPMETQTAALVKSIDQSVGSEMAQSVANMKNVQRGILLIVPATAICTFLIAAFFGWAVSRRMVELRLQERIGERTRIARELHDTLLQGVFSTSMQLNVAVDQLPEDSPARPSFARVVQLMGQVIEEGRNAVQGFRSIERETEDLERAFLRVPKELDLKDRVDFRVIVDGHRRLLRAVIHDEVYSIGREALVNAFRHSGASRIEVELVYTAAQLRILVCDDGCGIDAQVLQSGRDGHWGLPGMRERAAGIGAKLKVLSHVGRGTEVEVCVPADIAFEANASRVPSKWLAGLYGRKAAKGSAPQ